MKGVENNLKTLSKYGRIFNSSCNTWTEDMKYNIMYLKCLQHHYNDLLKYRGYVFLRDIYEELGFPITQESIVCGWKYDPENSCIDNYIDFGIDDIDENNTAIPLDFNVDGYIADKF